MAIKLYNPMWYEIYFLCLDPVTLLSMSGLLIKERGGGEQVDETEMDGDDDTLIVVVVVDHDGGDDDDDGDDEEDVHGDGGT